MRKRCCGVIAPLGVLLRARPRTAHRERRREGSDGKPVVKDIGSTGFVKCVPSGCVAEVEIDDKLHNELKNGSTRPFIIFDKPNEGRGLPLALNGYDRGSKR